MSRTGAAPLPSLPARYLGFGILGSLLIHLFLVAGLVKAPAPPTVESAILVSIEPDSTPRQIVSPTESQPTASTPPETNRESDRDLSTVREQIQRGDELAGPVAENATAPQRQAQPAAPLPETREQSARETKPQPQPQTKPEAKSESKLQPKSPPQQPAKQRAAEPPATTQQRPLDLGPLDAATLKEEFLLPAEKQGGRKNNNATTSQAEDPLLSGPANNLSQYAPFSRPLGSGAAFIGRFGSNDYLPSLPDGDITLLNAKANTYAVFVRRVATQVFAQMRSNGWDFLRGPELSAVRDFATVKVALSLKGEVLSVELDSSSGSDKFDKVVQLAAATGSRDPNPPAAAALEDGNVHLVFQARCWAELLQEPRTGRVIERRWLLLGTGLE